MDLPVPDLPVPQAGCAAPLHMLALALCVPPEPPASDNAAALWLHAQREVLESGADAVITQLHRWRERPAPQDAQLHRLAEAMDLSFAETLAVALAAAAETDTIVGRVLAWLQAPLGAARPTLGLVASIAERVGAHMPLAQLVGGPARASGLIHFGAENRPLPETPFLLPLSIVFALREGAAPVVPVGVQLETQSLTLPPSIHAASRARAQALASDARHTGGLVLRSGHLREARAAAALVAEALNARPAFVEGELPAGFGPWLTLTGCIPVLCAELAPGDRRRLPELHGWRGAWLVAAGPEGGFEREGEALPSWRIPVPDAEERIALWEQATGDAELARDLGLIHRHPAARIADLARSGQFQARLEGAPTAVLDHIRAAARSGVSGDLGTLAELLSESIPDDALVLPDATRKELEALAQRCRARDKLAEGLGSAARTRYRPAARALMVGPSGTGKTLAAGWLATRLGLPLYRVDLASVSSKYIGETEKNLAQLFARAEHAEAILLFDEADSLFGKRTEVKDSTDRYANQQTNYLLQRIESFDGIALLTSNSRARFDSAFTRRLDTIIDFSLPGPAERRLLWLAHLGEAHCLDAAQLNRVAALCELAGGHIRNAVLAARACSGKSDISCQALLAAIAAEYRKLGKSLPVGLSA
jgi:hypothetical protein